MIGLAKLQCSFINLADFFSRLLRMALHEVLDQHRNVLFPLPERRHVDREDIQPVKEVTPEHASSDGGSKSRFVAAITRTSTGMTRLPPTRSNWRSWRTRSNAS